MSKNTAENIIDNPTKDNEEIRHPLGRLMINAYYSFQDMKISYMNKLRDIVRRKNEGIAFNEVEEKKEEVLYDKKYTDRDIIDIMNNLLIEGKITKSEMDYFNQCYELIFGFSVNKMFTCKHCDRKSKYEIRVGGIDEYKKVAEKMIKDFIEPEPIYIEFLSKIRGMGVILSANLVKNLGYCEKANTVSQLWSYTGNSVVDGKAPKRKKGELLGFNIKLKTLTWIVSDSLMKLNKGYYRDLYDREKKKQLEREFEEGYLTDNYNGYKKEDKRLSKGHAHNRALRKMRKHFLSHYWECTRQLIGLPTKKTYVEGVLKHQHIISWQEALEMENILK